MKTRCGFVTNSSSASYIVHFETDLPADKVCKLFDLNRLAAAIGCTNPFSSMKSRLKHIGNRLWEVSDWTSMFNWPPDVDLYRCFVMRYEGETDSDVQLMKAWTEDSTGTGGGGYECQYENNIPVRENDDWRNSELVARFYHPHWYGREEPNNEVQEENK